MCQYSVNTVFLLLYTTWINKYVKMNMSDEQYQQRHFRWSYRSELIGRKNLYLLMTSHAILLGCHAADTYRIT